LLAAVATKHPLWCFADEYSNGTVSVAARACKRIWVPPATSIDAIGLAAQTLYFHKLLADQLKLEVDFLQVGKFKGAEEPFTRDGPSPEARQSLESTLDSLRAAWLDGIHAGRPAIGATVAEQGPYTPEEAKGYGLVDEVGYWDEARDSLEKATGALRAEVRVGPGARSGQFGDILRTVMSEAAESAPLVVVRAVGAISMEGGGALGASDGISAQHLIATLTRLERDVDVKAVVLRIDSPGGSALASDLLWHALMRIRGRKVLVVSIGDMAASGGYYLASSGGVVFADEASIVGSIGVVGGKIAADRALQRFGVHAETFPAKTGDEAAAVRAAYDSLFVPWDDATRDRVLATMTRIYELFLSRVSVGRGVPVARVAESAEGRIFGGLEARKRGLVDEIGGLREAIARARSLAHLSDDARVAVAGELRGVLGMLSDDDSRAGAATQPVTNLLGRTVAEMAPFVETVVPLIDGESVMCALPFALTIR
jgi:protease-4